MKKLSLLLVAVLLCVAGKSFAQTYQANESITFTVPTTDLITLANGSVDLTLGPPTGPSSPPTDGHGNDTYSASSNDVSLSQITAQWQPGTYPAGVSAWPTALVLDVTFTGGGGANAGTTEVDGNSCAAPNTCPMVTSIANGSSTGSIAYDLADSAGTAPGGAYSGTIQYTIISM